MSVHDEYRREMEMNALFDSVAAVTPSATGTDLARALAYRDEADPLFFKWQRGEAIEQEWLDKVAEIRERYPDAEPAAEE